MKHRAWVVAVVAAVACSKDAPKQPARVESLWKLAPPDAAGGVVLAPGAIAKLYDGWAEVERIAGGDLVASGVVQAMRDELRAGAPADPFDRAAVEALGLDTGAPAAMFFDADGEVILGVLPLKSATVLEKLAGSAPVERGGRRFYQTRKGDVCAEAAGRYLCGRDLATIDAAVKGAGTLGDEFPAAARGDVEVVADLPRLGADTGPQLVDAGKLHAGVRASGGVIALELRVAGALALPGFAVSAPPPKSFAGMDRGAPLPPELPLVEGFDGRRDGIEQITGDVLMATYGSSQPGGAVAIAMRDTTALKKALPSLCALAGARLGPELRLAMSGDRCHAEIAIPMPPDVPAGIFPASFAFDVEVRTDGVWMHFGGEPPGASLPGASEHTAPLLSRSAVLVAWGRSFDPLAAVDDATLRVVDGLLAQHLDDRQRGIVRAIRWGLAHIAEAGVVFAVEPKQFTVSAVVVTHAADPAAAYAAYEAAVTRLLDGDAAGYRAAMQQLAAAHPDTLAGRQARFVEAGAPLLGIGSGVIAAVAIPAFVKYVEKSRAAGSIE
jgi:hypothetical protein